MSNLTFTVDGVFHSDTTETTFQVDIRCDHFATEEEAREAVVALKFPKYAHINVTRVYRMGEYDYSLRSSAIFKPVKGNDKNEAGEKRIRAIAKCLKGTKQVRPGINWKTPLSDEQLNEFGFEL